MEKLIEEICNEKDYEKILVEIKRANDDSSIRKLLGGISDNNKLTQIEKNKCYEEIFDYVKEINSIFENKVKDIYFQGVKETIFKIVTLSNCLNKDMNEKDKLSNKTIYEMTVFEFINSISTKEN